MLNYDDLSEALKRTIIESVYEMKAPFVIFDGNNIIFSNERWLEHGANLLKLAGPDQTVEQIMYNETKRVVAGKLPDSYCKKVAREFSSAILNGETYEFRAASGHFMRGHYKKHESGLISGVEFDVTEIVAKRAEAKKARKLMQSTLEGLRHGVLLYDPTGKVIYFNGSMAKIAESMGIKLWDGMSHLEIREQLPLGLQDILGGEREDLSNFEVIQKASNDRFYMLENLGLKDVGYLVTAVDVTELQSALEDANKADVAKSDFLANMSHEIRTPLNGVLGMTQVLECTTLNDDQKKCVNVIKSSSTALLNIINDILDYSKLEANKYELFHEAFDLSDTIREVIDIVRPLAAEKDIEIIFDQRHLSREPLLGDAGKIRQIVLNLLSNAVKFTSDGYIKITVATEELTSTDRKVSICVTDTGIGIAKENIGRIFNSFEQSDNSTTRKFGGTGLGLAISKRLTDLMQGQISVDSVLGEGTTFSLSIEVPSSGETMAEPLVQARAFSGTPIIVVDNIPETRAIIDAQLSTLKVRAHHVTTAAHALECIRLAAAKNLQIPLVICDDKLPEQSGLDFVKAIRAGTDAPKTRVIILTTGDAIAKKPLFTPYGVNHVLEKPCVIEEIVEAVSVELTQHYAEQRSQKPSVAIAPKTQVTALPARPGLKKNQPYILVADDDELNQSVFSMFLEKLDCRFRIVNNGLEAIKAAAEESFDAILMDISMPVLNGVEAANKIREREVREGRASVPIIAVTAHALKGDREKYIARGFYDYVPKPIKMDELQSAIHRAMGTDQEMVFAI